MRCTNYFLCQHANWQQCQIHKQFDPFQGMKKNCKGQKQVGLKNHSFVLIQAREHWQWCINKKLRELYFKYFHIMYLRHRRPEQDLMKMYLGYRNPEQYVMKTPNANCFTIQYNTITRSSGEDYYYRMVLLDVVVGKRVSSFRTHVNRIKGWMQIGVTDRVTQKENNYPEDEHSISYFSSGGTINYVTADGKCQKTGDGIVIREGMELLMEVKKCEVTFTVFEGGVSRYKRKVVSPILRQPGRQFVPFFALRKIGDWVSWELQ